MGSTDKVPILSIPVDAAEQGGIEMEFSKFKKFSNLKLVQKFAVFYIIVGVVSFCLGLFLEISVLFMHCDECYGVKVSQIGCGLWCGFMFIGIGCAVLYISNSETLCSMITQMVISISSISVALLQIIFGIAAMINDHNMYRIPPPKTSFTTPGYHRWNHRYYHEVEFFKASIFLPAFIPNLFLTLLGFTMLILFFFQAVKGCRAACCVGKPVYLHINLFEPVTSPSNAYHQPYLEAVPGGYPIFPHGGESTHQPIILMGGNQTPSPYQTFQLVPVSYQKPPSAPTQTANIDAQP